MRNQKFLILLPILTLACSLTTPPVGNDHQAGAMQPTEKPVKIDLEGAALTAPSQVSPSPVPTPERCIVTTDVLQLRACAGTHCTVLDWLKEGEKLSILNANEGWLNVQTLAGKTGWVKAKYCGGPT